MGIRNLNKFIIVAAIGALLGACDATTTTQNGTAAKKSAWAPSTGARQTGTHMR